LNIGERQVSPTLEGIRSDHKYRYVFAATEIQPNSRVLDVACGVGYGSWILANAGHLVTAIDCDAEAIEYARTHYAHVNVDYLHVDANKLEHYNTDAFDYAVMFEAIEHIENPLPTLKTLHRIAKRLLASVPNELVFPFKGYKYHHRHYTPNQFDTLLAMSGYRITRWCGQHGTESPVETDVIGRTLVVFATKSKEIKSLPPPHYEVPKPVKTDKHICILGLGPSLESYIDLVKRMGGRSAFCDEVWSINSLGEILQCDKIFHMDDVRIQEIRATAAPKSNIAEMLKWMRKHPGPIITSRAHPDYPGLIEFPLQDVMNSLGYAYFNGTAAYAVAYAIYYGATKISLFGCDFTYPNAHQAEKGRACVEFWLGIAAARGIKLAISQASTLMDTNEPEDRLYGYDTVNVIISQDAPGALATVTFEEKEEIATAEEIEARYNHEVHPNKLVQQESNAVV
jgi:SAM-dependent methyltransferase